MVFHYFTGAGSVRRFPAFADARFCGETSGRVFTPFQVFRCRVLVSLDSGGGSASVVGVSLRALVVARRPLLAAPLLTQLEDQLSRVMRDHGVVVFQDDTFKLKSPFPLLFQIPGLFDPQQQCGQ